MQVIGRIIKNDKGETVGKILGDRPHIADLQKGYRSNFVIVWADGQREPLPFFSYFRDVVRYIKAK